MDIATALAELHASHINLQRLIYKLPSTRYDHIKFITCLTDLSEFTTMHLTFEHRLMEALGVVDPDHALKHEYLQRTFHDLLIAVLQDRTPTLIARIQCLFQDHIDTANEFLEDLHPTFTHV